MLLLSGLCRSCWTPKLLKALMIISVQSCSARSGLGERGHILTRSNRSSAPEDRADWEALSVGKSGGASPPREENTLSEQEEVIHRLHQEACRAGERTYTDPLSGLKVFTEFAHKQRGRCCGSACRHCPYGQMNVEDASKKKTFNSAFYV